MDKFDLGAALLESDPQNGILDTDMANAERFAKQHGADVRYSREKGFFVWDGRRFVADTSLAINKAKQTAKSIVREIETAPTKAVQKTLLRHAHLSQDSRRLTSMLYLAQSEPGIPASLNEFDADPWRLNVQNGIINLRTGELEPHNQKHLCSRISNIKFDSAAKCELWLSFLHKITNGNVNQMLYLNRAIGYSLTGSTGEQCLFFLFGIGANGKSVFLNILGDLCGEYGMSSRMDSFTLQKNGGSIPNDIARLAGARLVAVSETADGQRLHEPLIKDLTGGDLITARFLHHEFFDFRPQFKIWIRGNHKPQITGTDEGIWRRIHLVPFTVTIPESERDPALYEKLRAELPGIMAWAVRGCLDWQRSGLQAPDMVRAAVKEYRAEMDILGAFLSENCLIGESFKVSAKALYASYRTWAEKNGERSATQRRFGSAMTERGFDRERTRGGYFYLKIGLCVNDVNDCEPKTDFSPLTRVREEENPELGSQGSQGSHAAEIADIETVFPEKSLLNISRGVLAKDHLDLGNLGKSEKCSPCGRVEWCIMDQGQQRELCEGPF